MKQHVGGTCPVTVVLSKQATLVPMLKAHTTATSAVAIQRPFSLKCRHVLRILIMSRAAPRHMTDAQKVTKKMKKSAKGSDHVVLGQM